MPRLRRRQCKGFSLIPGGGLPDAQHTRRTCQIRCCYSLEAPAGAPCGAGGRQRAATRVTGCSASSLSSRGHRNTPRRTWQPDRGPPRWPTRQPAAARLLRCAPMSSCHRVEQRKRNSQRCAARGNCQRAAAAPAPAGRAPGKSSMQACVLSP